MLLLVDIGFYIVFALVSKLIWMDIKMKMKLCQYNTFFAKIIITAKYSLPVPIRQVF